MSLMSRKSDTHNHLAGKVVRKHSSLHTVTASERPKHTGEEAQPKRERPFGELQFGSGKDDAPRAYKSILDL